MAQFIPLTQEQINNIMSLCMCGKDNEYIVLSTYRDNSTICQYSSKYNNVHIVTVLSDKLDTTKAFNK